VALAIKYRLAGMYPLREFMESGGLMAYLGSCERGDPMTYCAVDREMTPNLADTAGPISVVTSFCR
jgi:hypothetical protein